MTDGQLAVITGTAGGIGAGIADVFAAAGWRVIGVDRVAHALRNGDGLAGDVADETFWQSLAARLGSDGRVDALVHNAAVQPVGDISELTPEQWRRTQDVNVTAAYLGTRALLEALVRAQGAVVNVASVHVHATARGLSAYAASKGALMALTRSLAVELADRGVRVNAVLPGAVDTPMLRLNIGRGLTPWQAEANVAKLAAKTPLGRIGRPADIGKAVLFLADADSAAFITGQGLVVDGGALAQLSTE